MKTPGERNPGEKSPVSFKINVLRLPRKGMPVEIVADEKQRAALAAAHELVSVERFEADLVAKPWKADGVRVDGIVRANITQACVVTLEPIEAQIEEEVSATFVPEESRLARNDLEGGEFVVDAEGPDMPEPFSGDFIDIGALAEEFFALGVDPYPRKEGTVLGQTETEPDVEEKAGPLYEQLKKLQQKP